MPFQGDAVDVKHGADASAIEVPATATDLLVPGDVLVVRIRDGANDVAALPAATSGASMPASP